MRRPTPLPAPPSTGAAGDADAPVEVSIPLAPRRPEPVREPAPASCPEPSPESTGDDATDHDLDAPAWAATSPLAPVVPIEERGTSDPAESDEEAATDAAPIGVRDVWAAARARRRALRAEVRRFTVRQRRRRMLWIGVLGALALLVLGTLGAAYSPLFAVERIRVVGAETLNPGDVEAALDGQLGTPLPLIDSSEIKAALVQFPLVQSYTLEARPPHELVVRIVERTPIGAVQSAAGYTLVDAAGVALATTPDAPAGHPVIEATGGIGSPAFTAIGTVYRSLPDDIRAQVTTMRATTANDVTLTLGGTNTDVVWGNADDSAEKAVRLAAAMAVRPPADVYSYDVSSVDAVVVR